MKHDYIYEAFHQQPIIELNEKKYCINSLTDHQPITSPFLLNQIIQEFSEKVNYNACDFLVGEEDRGGYLCAVASYAWRKPFTLTKWNPSGLQGEVAIDFRNTYTHGKLYLNGIKDLSGKKAIIVEDIVDSGGTIIAMIKLLQKNNIEVIDVIAVAEKMDYQGVKRIYEETGIQAKVLIQFISGEKKSSIINRF